MKQEIITYIQEVIAEKGGIYTALFGCNEIEKLRILNINWIINKNELKESIEIILENIISQILQSYNVSEHLPDKYQTKSFYKIINFDNNIEQNRFLSINYEITNDNVKFTDLENYLDDISVTDNGPHIYFKWSFPIYKIQNNVINTF